MVKSGQSNPDSLLILEFILTQQQLVSCLGSFSMPSSPSTGPSFVRMVRQHTNGCSARLMLRSCGSFRGKSSGSCSSHPSLPKASFEGSASAALPIVFGNMCHHWNAHHGSRKSDSPNPNSSNSMLLSSAKSFFLLMNQNLTFKNIKKIALLSKNCLGHSSYNRSQRCKTKTSSH